MPNDYYPDADAEEMKGDGGMEQGEGQEAEPATKTALIPKSILGGKEFKVGDEVVLKITHDYEDEVAVEYAPEKPTETPTEEETELPELAGREEFDNADKEAAYA